MMATVLAMFGLHGGMEWVVILGLALLFFGNRIPTMARSLGQGIVEFRKGLKGEPDKKKLPGEGEENKGGGGH